MCLKITFPATGPSLAKDDSKIIMEILCLGKGKMKRDTVAYRRKGAMVRGHRVSAVKRGNSPKRRSERELWARGQPNQGCARLWTCDLTRFNFSWSNPFVIEKKSVWLLYMLVGFGHYHTHRVFFPRHVLVYSIDWVKVGDMVQFQILPGWQVKARTTIWRSKTQAGKDKSRYFGRNMSRAGVGKLSFWEGSFVYLKHTSLALQNY